MAPATPSEPAPAPFTYTDEEKAMFAAVLVRKPDGKAFDAAREVFGDTQSVVGKCLYASTVLPSDPFVIDLIKKLKGAGETAEVPSKEQAALRVWEWTKDSSGRDLESKVKAMTLFCKIMKYTEDQAAVQVNVNRVMEVPVHATDDVWQQRLKEQQAKLTNQNVH